MNKIVIGNCYKEKQEDCISLCADFKLGKEKFKMHFDVPKEYAEFICDDYSDPFVLMTIEYGMATKSDIECIQPMSEDLYYQMTNYFIPLLAENTKTFHRINLSAPTKKLVHGGVVR